MNPYYVNFELHKLPVFQQIQIKGVLRVIAFQSPCSIINIGFKKARSSFKLGLHRKLLSIIFLASGHCLESDYPIRSDSGLDSRSRLSLSAVSIRERYYRER